VLKNAWIADNIASQSGLATISKSWLELKRNPDRFNHGRAT
jgi:hypothetical protein